MISKPDICRNCALYSKGTGFVPPQNPPDATTILIGEAPRADDVTNGRPFSDGCGSLLNNLLFRAGLNRSRLAATNTICCRPPGDIHPYDKKYHATSKADGRAAVAYCRQHHLNPVLDQKTKIIATGEAALQALTGKKGILIWRGSPLPLQGQSTLSVIPTLSPIEIVKNFKFTSIVAQDLAKQPKSTPEYYNLFATPEDLKQFTSQKLAFDFEWDYNNDITIAGISSRFFNATVGSWGGNNINEFKRIFENASDLIGHNIIGADTKQFEAFGWTITAKMHDTMLKQHLFQPDFKHDLGFVGSVFTNKIFWKGRGKEEEDEDGNIIGTKEQWKTWNQPDGIPRSIGGYAGCSSADEAYRLYNARDTDGSFQINEALDPLLKQWGLDFVYWNVSVPIAYVVRDIADAGIRIDSGKVDSIRVELEKEVEQLETTLPNGLRPITVAITKSIAAPEGTFKSKSRVCKGTKKAPHGPIELTFRSPRDILQCSDCQKSYGPFKLPVVKKVKVAATKVVRPWTSTAKVQAYAASLKLKQYINRKRGTAGADVNARKGWGRTNPEFKIVDQLKDKITLVNNFAKGALAHEKRLYFNLLVHGTSEGRFSSSGKRKGIDPNIQNQPKSVRKIYIPDYTDWSFLELDYASAENMLTAYLAKDYSRLERLRQPGYSEHLDLARALFDLPNLEKGSKEPVSVTWTEAKKTITITSTQDKLYDVGKIVNHLGNYGGGYKKVSEVLESEGFFYSKAKCKQFVKIRQELNPATALWQEATIEQANRDGYLRNAFGRIRWFSSRSSATQALAFLPASTLADIIIRAMVAHYPVQFQQEIINLQLERTGYFEKLWRISAQVHDSLLLQGPSDYVLAQAAITKAVMEQPWQALQGFSLATEVKIGAPGDSWGQLKVVKL